MKKEKEKAKKTGGAAAKRGRSRKDAASLAVERRQVVAELRAFAHPLRLRLFELFAEKPRTTMQVAELLGEPPTRLYHHVNALQKSGLLRLRETKPNRGTVEKYFEAVQPDLNSAKADVFATSAAARQSARAAAATVFEQARQDLFAGMRDLKKGHETAPMLIRMLVSATPTRAAALRRRLLDLLKDLKAADGAEKKEAAAGEAGEQQERWSLTIAFARAWPPGPRGTPGKRAAAVANRSRRPPFVPAAPSRLPRWCPGYAGVGSTPPITGAASTSATGAVARERATST